MTDLTYTVTPGSPLRGDLLVPGDKSISHRAIMLGALADGVTEISGFLTGADCLATLSAFRAMGVEIRRPQPEQVIVQGVGLHGLQAPDSPLDMGNAGTAMRLLVGVLAGQRFDSVLTGDGSLSARPMRRVTDPLAAMGARIDTSAAGTAPLHVHGSSSLRGIDYELPKASAQVKSCVLLAGLYAKGETRVTEPAPTRDHTERMLQRFGYPLQRAGASVALTGGGRLAAGPIQVPSDISSAAFLLVGASIAGGSELTLKNVGLNPTRTGVIEILKLMGADLRLCKPRELGGEPVADILVRSAPLTGIEIPPALVPLAIDEFPALFVAAACAEGETVLTGAAELRVKESDRIQVMADGLQSLGVDAKATADGMIIRGGSIGGGEVQSHGDHRVAMALAMAGLRSTGPVTIHDCANVDTSFPGFVELTRAAGLRIEQSRADS